MKALATGSTWLVRCLVVLLLAAPLLAQYTDLVAINDLGGPQEFARRRQELAKHLQTGYLILFARTILPEANHYREDNDFFYFTGLSDPGAILLMNVSKGDVTIFEPQQSPRTKQVYGANLLAMTPEAQEKLGFKTVLPIGTLDSILANAVGREGDLWLRLNFADKADGARPETGRDYAAEYSSPYGDPLPGDRAALKKLAERYPAAHQRDATQSGEMSTTTPAQRSPARFNSSSQRWPVARPRWGSRSRKTFFQP